MTISQDINIHSRLKSERMRADLDQAAVAELCGVSLKTVSRWENYTPIPADKLAILASKGFDAYYILVGRPEDALQDLLCTPDEVELIDEYRNLPEDQKKAVRQMTQAWSLQAVQKGTSQLIRKPKKRN